MKYFKKLLGDRIYLSPRNVEQEDIEKFTIWLNDFKTTDYIGRSNQVVTLEGERKYLEDHLNDKSTFLIIELENDNMIGTVGIEKINNIDRTGTLGIFIGEESARNKGYGTEAINLVLDYGFNYLNLNNIKLDVLESNERAIACYKKCGFREYGRRRKAKYTNGKYYDIISMDILKEEFIGKSYIKNKNI